MDYSVKTDNYNIRIKLPSTKLYEIEDLTEKLTGKIPNAIFNAYVVSNQSVSSSVLTIKESDKEDESFLLCPFDKEYLNSKTNEINIPVEKHCSENGNMNEKKYYRFRVKNFDSSMVIIESILKNKSFESSFLIEKIIDFRINDTKLMEQLDIQKAITQKTKFQKVHFLYMTDINEDIQLKSDVCYPRFLERGIWDNYLDLSERKKKFDMIAYHLKSSNVFSTCFLIKGKYQKTSLCHLLVYAGIVIVLAIIANCFTRCIP